MGKRSGFTLIELIVVIAILGILAAVALPKFVDVKSDAEIAALSGVAGTISSASALNYAAKVAGKTSTQLTTCNTTHLGNVLVTGWPTGYTVGPAATYAAPAADGDPVACTLTQTSSGRTLDFTAVGRI
jgi:MSHA pilin protein MshA